MTKRSVLVSAVVLAVVLLVAVPAWGTHLVCQGLVVVSDDSNHSGTAGNGEVATT